MPNHKHRQENLWTKHYDNVIFVLDKPNENFMDLWVSSIYDRKKMGQ